MSVHELEELLIEFLARVYRVVPWGKIKVRSPHDVFNHRVRAASRRGTLYAFASKLSNYFSLQSLPAESIALLDKIREAGLEEKALALLAEEHIPLCVRAFLKAKSLKVAQEKTLELPIEGGKDAHQV